MLDVKKNNGGGWNFYLFIYFQNFKEEKSEFFLSEF